MCENCKGCQEYEVVFKFNNIVRLTEFMEYASEWNKGKEPRVERRGQHTKKLHEEAKEFHKNHPQYDYHTCMKLCRQVNRIPLHQIDLEN